VVPVSEAHKLGPQCAYLRNRKKTTTPPASLKETLVPVAGMCLFCCCFCCWCSFCRETGHHSAVLFVSQCCNLATVLFNFPFLSLFSVQHNGACMAAAVTPRVGHRNAVFFCITMLQPVSNAVLFSFPFLSLFFLRHNGACMATQCWHPMLLHSNNAAVCATHCYAWQHNDHLRSHSQLQQEVQHRGLHPAVKPVAQSGGEC